MSRHRNVRKIDIDAELSDDVYGRSCDDDYCVSPSTEAEYMFQRDKQHTLSSFIDRSHENNIIEEEYDDYYDEGYYKENDPNTNDKLQFCIDQMNDVLGDSVDKNAIAEATVKHNGNLQLAMNQVLDGGQSSPYLQPKSNSATAFYNSTAQASPTPKKKAPHKDVSPKGPKEKCLKKDENANTARVSTPTLPASANIVGTEVPTDVSTPKATKSRGKDLIDVKAELKKREDGKQNINLVVIGHVDAGKSTLMGHLLYNLGNVPKKVMHKNEMESKKSGKGSFAFAWVLDETEEERTRGVTIDIAMTVFETKSKIVTLMDAPGHRDFIPNMIQGTAQADVAILVVDSRPGEFEAGFEAGGQTREHAILARSLGVGQLVVAVNKMDSIEWSKERYNAIVIKLKTFLTKHAGFKEADVYYIPCSGLSGENLTEEAKEPGLLSWYKDQCLVELIDKFRSPERPVDKAFRFCVSDVYKGQGSIVVAGKIETGYIQNGERVTVMPAGESGIIKGLQSRELPVTFAAAGDHITGALHGVDMDHLSVGSILCDVSNPIKTTSHIVSRIVVFENQIPITKGFMIVFHSQNLTEPATISKLVSILHKASGEVIQKRPRCLTKQMNAVIEIKFSRPVCIELYRDNKVLGRFMLRYSGRTIAAGVVTEVK